MMTYDYAQQALKEQEGIIAEANRKLAVIKAFLIGSPIEYRNHRYDKKEWKGITDPRWVWGICDYRVRPAPTNYCVVFTRMQKDKHNGVEFFYYRREDLIFFSEEDAKRYAEAYMRSEQGKTCMDFKIEIQAG